MLNFEQYLLERTSSVSNRDKKIVSEEELREMIANRDTDIAKVDVGRVTNMKNLFADSHSFGKEWTADISDWDTSNVTDMSGMFFYCKNFNQDLSKWNIDKVKDFSLMFSNCLILDQNFKNWDTTNKETKFMFLDCKQMKENNLPKGYTDGI